MTSRLAVTQAAHPPSPSATVAAFDAEPELSAWTNQLASPVPEPLRTKWLARIGGLTAVIGLVLYISWRIGYTLPHGGSTARVAWALVAFESLPLFALVTRTITLWSIDCTVPPPVPADDTAYRVAVLVPTYNEPAEVLVPTVAAACALEPAHETWVLDDGDRLWVKELCQAYGARYVSRDEHDHAKAGNLNNALAMIKLEREAGISDIDVVAVLDCDHVPLPAFLTATLGWFEDETIALVQGPQAYYNSGAFDDDGASGEQGMFFNVLLPSRQHAGVGPFWCGSTSLLRVSALEEVGGVATQTVTEDMHTTLLFIRANWKTVYHHQTLAVGLAPSTPEQYLMQRRRWGMGSMQILAHERLWKAKSWLSWRNFFEYLNGTLWWLEGVATLIAFMVPLAIMVSGVSTSTADPAVFTLVFATMFSTRLWGMRRLMRKEIHIRTAFALRVLRIPVGVACLWWLVTRRTLEFEVTAKGGSGSRRRGRIPGVVWAVAAIVGVTAAYAAAGLAGAVPWRTDPASTTSSGLWLLLAAFVLISGTRRIRASEFATSRRNAHRVGAKAPVTLHGVSGRLVDISTSGAAVEVPAAQAPGLGVVELSLPDTEPVKLLVGSAPRPSASTPGQVIVSLQALTQDWGTMHTLSMWMFHTPDGVVPGLPAGVPAVAVR